MDTDSWWHLRAGEWIVENRAVLQTDLFSYTRLGSEWKYPGWLFETPMYLIFARLGPGGLNLLTAGMVTLAFVFLWFTLRGGVFLRALVMILAASVSGVYWSARPHLVTLLFTAVFLCILEAERWRTSSDDTQKPNELPLRGFFSRQPGWRLWFLPVIMVFWVNSHGGFAVGFILCGLYAFARLVSWSLRGELFARIRTVFSSPKEIFRPDYWLFWATLVMLLTACVNPSGVKIFLYPFDTVTITALQENIQEWQSPNFHQLSVQPFIWMLLAILAAVGSSRRKMALTDFLLTSVFAYMALLAGRNLALFALVAAPALARHAEPLSILVGRKLKLRTEESSPKSLQWVNAFILLLLGVAGFLKTASIYPEAVNQAAFRKFLPVEAVEFIREDMPTGNLFNSYNWGGYLIWALPETSVFVDGRTDLYNDEIISQWLQAYQGQPGWDEILQRWQVTWVLIEKDAPLRRLLEQSGWTQLYADDLAVVFRR